MLHKNRMLLLSATALTCLASCGTEDLTGQSDPTSDALVAAPATAPAPTPPPAVATTPPPSLGNVELPVINSGVNTVDWLREAGTPSSMAPDVVGAFRFHCAPSHLSYDDPVVHLGKPGAAHLHVFFGNTLTNANSTYDSLRKTGESTCMNMLNRSAYWMPALLDGQGSALMPDLISIYYKRRPSSDIWFANNGNAAASLPRGLRYVFGNPTDPSAVHFKCIEGFNDVGTKGTMSHALSQCGAGQSFVVSINSPNCWDGKNLDSPDHRSHMSYEARDVNTGKTYCPATHPYVLPVFTMSVIFSIENGDMPTLWRFSSDMDGVAPGSTFHADWFGAWEDSVLQAWQENCIEKLLSCSDGNLGNGKALKRNSLYPSGKANPRKVPLSTIG